MPTERLSALSPCRTPIPTVATPPTESGPSVPGSGIATHSPRNSPPTTRSGDTTTAPRRNFGSTLAPSALAPPGVLRSRTVDHHSGVTANSVARSLVVAGEKRRRSATCREEGFEFPVERVRIDWRVVSYCRLYRFEGIRHRGGVEYLYTLTASGSRAPKRLTLVSRERPSPVPNCPFASGRLRRRLLLRRRNRL